MRTTQMTPAEIQAVANSPRVKARLDEIQRRQAEAVDTTRSVAERIAGDMIDIAAVNSDCCLDKDLLLRGWTLEALRQHGDEANRIAIAKAEEARA